MYIFRKLYSNKILQNQRGNYAKQYQKQTINNAPTPTDSNNVKPVSSTPVNLCSYTNTNYIPT